MYPNSLCFGPKAPIGTTFTTFRPWYILFGCMDPWGKVHYTPGFIKKLTGGCFNPARNLLETATYSLSSPTCPLAAIRIGFWGPFYYTHNLIRNPKIVLATIQAPRLLPDAFGSRPWSSRLRPMCREFRSRQLENRPSRTKHYSNY